MAKTVLVFIRRCVDYTVHIRIKADGSDVEKSGVKMSVNPFDEIALQSAIDLKSKGDIDHITIIAMGETQVQDTLRHGLAMGADHAIYIESARPLYPLENAKILSAIAKRKDANIVMLGKQSIDDDFGHEPFMCAALLNWNYAHAAASIDAQNDDFIVQVETDTGLAQKELIIPCVISADLRLAEPQKVPLPKVIAARKIEIETINIDDILDQKIDTIQTINVEPPRPRDPVIILENVDDVALKIKELLS